MSSEPSARPTLGPRRRRSILSRVMRRIIVWFYQAKGWEIDGGLPRDLRKYVIAGAPHTSNWDFVFFAGASQVEGIEPSFMGKHTLFRGGMRRFMFDMGGIPIDRTRRSNYVAQVADEFERRDHLVLVIAAEGSRMSDGRWKSGFYHIAQAANVPIVPAWVCNDRRVLGFGEPLWPTRDYGADLLKIAQFMRSKLPDNERFKVLEAQARELIEETRT